MIRKLILGAVTAAAVGFGGPAWAHEPVGFPPRAPVGGPGGPIGPSGGIVPGQVDYDFVVMVRYLHGDHWHWERYGRYETRREAERVERWLERQGHRVRVEEVRDRRPRW